MFTLNSKLVQVTFFIKSLDLSELVLMDNQYYPCLILVPRVESISEVIELSETQKQTLYSEINLLSKLLKSLYTNCKLNIATIGNVVNQLHVHIISRNVNDVSWPNGVWGER